MKTAFVLHHVLVAVSYPCAFAAEAAGLVPAALVSLPVLAGFYVVAGLVAFAFEDYGRAARRAVHRRPQLTSLQPHRPASRDLVSSWAYRTSSV